MHIVLVEPEIPQNTGNIARTCALTGTALHLVKPLGFSVADRYLKRAGLDYWNKVNITIWENFGSFMREFGEYNIFLATTKAPKLYDQVIYEKNDVFIFGPESRGLSNDILQIWPKKQIRIPMLDIGRSLNLANAAAVLIYEALRQLQFPNLK